MMNHCTAALTLSTILGMWVALPGWSQQPDRPEDRTPRLPAFDARLVNFSAVPVHLETASGAFFGPFAQATQPPPTTTEKPPEKKEKAASTPNPKVECPTAPDCREAFESSFYLGIAIDSFAAGATKRYLNPSAANGLQERGVAGIDFAYRLFGAPNSTVGPADPDDPSEDEKKSMYKPSKTQQLWIYGETVHGARSTDVNCKDHPGFPTCQSKAEIPGTPLDNAIFILRNATSLEGFMGLRYEFLTLQSGTKYPANLYFKAQAGFLTVTNSGDSAKDIDHIGLGALITKGDFQSSYLEVGWGRTDLFAERRRRRYKVDAYISRNLNKTISLFAQLLVDTDLGPHADSFQTYIGFNWDFRNFDFLSAINPMKKNSAQAGGGK